MPNKKISELNAAGTITGVEMIELVQGGLSVRSTVTNITVSASYANTASYVTASNVIGIVTSASYAISASYASSTSDVTSVPSASWASSSISASYSTSASWAPMPSVSNSSSWASSSISASYADKTLSASYAPSSGGTSLITGSTYPITSSWAVNVVNGGTGTTAYTTITTSSTNWITCSFSDTREYINIAHSASYNFTCSNVPTSNQIAEVSLFINNTVNKTSLLSFPANWIFLGSKPTAITASKSGILSLQSYGPSIQVAGFSVQY